MNIVHKTKMWIIDYDPITTQTLLSILHKAEETGCYIASAGFKHKHMRCLYMLCIESIVTSDDISQVTIFGVGGICLTSELNTVVHSRWYMGM